MMQVHLIAATIVLFLSLVLVASGDTTAGKPDNRNVPSIFNYANYVNKFRKDYKPMEALNKAKLFFGRTLKIFHHNVQYKNKNMDYYLSQNQFTDMTPRELMLLRNEQDDELKLVEEAEKNPDLPASSSITVARLTQAGEGESSASLDDLEPAKLVPKKQPIVDFMNDDLADSIELSKLMERLRSTPKGLKTYMENVMESSEKGLEDLKSMESERAKKALEENQVNVKPIPKPTNKHYDMDTIVSYGSGREMYEEFAKNYGKFLMEDPDFEGLNLTPYQKPPEVESKKIKDTNEDVSSPLGDLMNSMKSIYDFFIVDYDETQDTDVAPSSVEKPQVVDNKPVDTNLITYDIDWRKTGCLTKAKNQKECNACYAFSTLALMEYFHCMQTKQLTEFSAQYIVDCGTRNNLHGCHGGKLSSVGQFIRNYGIELDNTYPYQAAEGQCSIDESNLEKAGFFKPQIAAWQSFPSIGAWYKWLPKSPIIVGISMPSDFFGYAGGIHDGSSCDEKSIHALLLVGSGKQDGKEFWLLKNSYSEDWGEAGYFRLSKAAPMRCFNSAVVARPKFAPK